MSNSKFLKHVLVEQAELDRLRERQIRDYSPEIHSMARIKDEIDRTLLDSKLSPQQKLDTISGMQQRFDRLRAETNTLNGATAAAGGEAPAAAKAEPRPKAAAKRQRAISPGPPDADESDHEADDSRAGVGPILNPIELGVPPEYRKRAASVLRKIAAHPDVITRNEEGEVVYNGEAVPNSNFDDIMLKMFSSGNTPDQIGITELFKGLRQLRVTGGEMVSSRFRGLYTDPPRMTVSTREDLNPFDVTQATASKAGPSKRHKPDHAKGRRSSLIPQAPTKKGQSGHGRPPGTRPTILYVY